MRQSGQAAVLIVGALFGLLVGAFVLGAVARGIGARSAAQRSADLAALAGARAMLDAHPRLYASGSQQLSRAAYLELGEQAALDVAARNGEEHAAVSFPDADGFAPVRIHVEIRREVEVRRAEATAATEVEATAEAELSATSLYANAAGGEYAGPFAVRQGHKMRPDVALAFDRMAAAASADGIALIISSAWRSDAEQAILFARNPDPKWVAPPGTSLHRLGTELDLGPSSAYGWLAANAPRFGFVLRYSWEPWHWGYARNASSLPRPTADGSSAVPDFVPVQYADDIALAAQRWNVSANLLSAQLYAESGFNRFAVSPVGAQGIAQFMPGTAAAMGLADPFDATAAIDAQAHLMRDLLRRFGSVPLALAAYNAGPTPVAACMCVPPYSETQAYVAHVLGLMGGAGELAGGLTVRLVK